MEERPSDITLIVAKLAAVFSSLVAVMYAAAGSEPAPVVALFVTVGPLLAVTLWLQKDARRSGVGQVQDWGYFVWLARAPRVPGSRVTQLNEYRAPRVRGA